MSREVLQQGCRWAERKVYSPLNTTKRLLQARIFHPPVLMANAIYATRIARRNNLIPIGEQFIDGQEEMASAVKVPTEPALVD